jgi:hypothetical protein
MFRGIAAAAAVTLGTVNAPAHPPEKADNHTLVALSGPESAPTTGPRTADEIRHEHDTRLRESIAEFKASGATVTVGRTVNSGADSLMLLSMPEESRVRQLIGNTPLQQLEGYGGAIRDVPLDLRTTNSVSICPLSFASRQEGGKITVELFDHLVGDRVMQESFPTNIRTNDAKMNALYKRLQGLVADTLTERRANHEAILANIQPALSFTPLLETSPVSGEGKSSVLNKLAPTEATVILGLQRAGRTAEEPTTIQLRGAQLDKLADRTIRINGLVDVIAFVLPPERAAVDLKAKTVNGESLTAGEVDSNSTAIERRWRTMTRNESEAQRILSIYPTIPFADQFENQPHRTLRIDTSWLGLEGEPLVISQAVLQRATQTANYSVYGDLGAEPIATQIRDSLPAVNEGAASVESLFGLTPGTIQKRVMIVDSDHINGSYRSLNKGTTFLHDEALIRPDWALTISRHETLHLIDFELGKEVLSNGSLHAHFVKLSEATPSFFLEINESQFLPDISVPHAGHAQDNAAELFATFMNGIMSHDWSERIVEAGRRSKDRELFLNTYAQTITEISASISENPSIPASAPIHTLLAERERQLAKLRR